MNESPLSKYNWANGQPSIEIDSYQHTRVGFEALVGKLARALDLPKPKIKADGIPDIPSLMSYETEFVVGEEKIEFEMNEYSCTIGFQTEKLRDEVYSKFLAFI
ncbi:MAG: hypothetical protein EOP05_11350 [Proteobacteria bacterium]|nr:MAG: hypothetical protein EOP05_11350 [Pseudomonadota bacterium]